MLQKMKIGTQFHNNSRGGFTVWAPFREEVFLKILTPAEQMIPMLKDDHGYWHAKVKNLDSSAQYLYVLEESLELPDPVSYFQPEGVHGPSQVVDHNDFTWHSEGWKGIPLSEMIIYEIHTGTFSKEGAFKGIAERLEDLLDLGINAIEIMPVAQFPGERNWGYDGVYPFAVQNSYGGPEGFKNLIDTCHSCGIAVILDVVYNHLGPEGNYLHDFGPYFTDKYKTPWGKAINFDDAYSDHVRNFFVRNSLYWFEHYRIDALRLDAIHAICDNSAKPFLEELGESIDEYSKSIGKKFYLIAESDLNDMRIIRPRAKGGFGIDAQWSDDLHHSIHTLLTNEDTGYYKDFGKLSDLSKALKETFVYDGKYSKYRKRPHGNSAKEFPGDQFVVSLQNHDQVGNRLLGERLASILSFEALKLAAGILFLSPNIPLLFMGEEYAENNPFLYFISHSDEELIKAVQKGRQRDFESFKWKGNCPDPQSEETFLKSRLDWDKRLQGEHETMLGFYKYLIQLRKNSEVLKNLDKNNLSVSCQEKGKIIQLKRWFNEEWIISFFNFSKEKQNVQIDSNPGFWNKIVDSAEEKWGGPSSSLPEEADMSIRLTIQPTSLAVYKMEK